MRKNMNEHKEKHPIYRLVMLALVLLLAIGVFLLAVGLTMGGGGPLTRFPAWEV